MYRTFLSLRYLRARRTNLIGVTGIFVGVGALILILSIMAGFLEESRETVRGSLADLVIQPLDLLWADDGPPEGPERILEVVRADPGVAAASAQLAWFGLVAHRGGRDADARTKLAFRRGELPGVQVVGIDVEDEFGTTDLREALEREPLFEGYSKVEDPADPFAPPPGYAHDPSRGRPLPRVVVGEQLYRGLGLSRGAQLNLMTAIPQANGEPIFNNAWYVVAGTFRSRDNEMDLGRVYMERSELSRLLSDEEYSQILVRLKDYERDAETVRDRLTEKLAAEGLIRGVEREVRTWEDFRSYLLAAIENEKTLMAIMLSLVLVVAGFTIFAILSMMVTEKRRDIGILCALGATRGGILHLFLLIGFWDALFGALLGGVFGTWAALKIDAIERWLSRTFGIEIFNRDVYIFDYIPSRVEPVGVALIVLGAFACTLLFAALPAVKAARLNPIDALRYE